ncbi:MAG: ComEA family DNA-binding protein, partial [Mycobacterium leprae]
RALDANVGPELWLLNERFPIPASFINPQRTHPLSLNLNAASVADLMTIEGIDLALAQRIVSVRRQAGFFRSLDDLSQIEGVTVPLRSALRLMQAAMLTAGDHARM